MSKNSCFRLQGKGISFKVENPTFYLAVPVFFPRRIQEKRWCSHLVSENVFLASSMEEVLYCRKQNP
jgi:hypothetical protein